MAEASSAPQPRIELNPDQWADWRWRLHNLYTIVTDHGKEIPFRPNEMQTYFLNTFWYLNVILKARQHGFCLDPQTRVLTADLCWVPIGNLMPGQQIIAVDEYPLGGKGQARKMRTATVHAAVEVYRKAYRITFDDGRSVVCTGQHPWLSKKANSQSDWRKIESENKKKLTVGTWVRWMTKPWDAPTAEDGWFGGMLDGEGTMANGNSSMGLSVSQRNGPVFNRLIDYCQSRGYAWRIESDKAERKSKYGKAPVPRICLGRMDELFRVIGQCRPTRFLGKHWWEGRELPGKRNSGIGWARITSIEPLDERTMIDLQTSTGTYIAEGFVSHNTTIIDLLMLDQCVFNSNISAGIIAHNLDDAGKIFRNKILFPYKHLPDQLRSARPLEKDTGQELVFDNGSSIGVGTSMRSGTLQYLHVSEFGKIAAKYPDKAREIATGSFNTVHAGQYIFVESTAEGRGGRFFDITKKARKHAELVASGAARLTEMDFKFHFFPWYHKPEYTMDPAGVPIPEHYQRYFLELEVTEGVALTPGQRAWYVKKSAMLVEEGETDEDMKREFPSTPDEAFMVSVKGTYYGAIMAKLRKQGQIRKVPHVPTQVVNTFWDLGRNDSTAIWFHQYIASENRFIKFYQDDSVGLAHYVKYMQDECKGFLWGRHYLPHDAENKNLERNEDRVDRLVELGVPRDKIVVVERVEDIEIAHELTRAILPRCYFDIEECDTGIGCMESYQKEWDEKQAVFRNHPLHNWASHGASAFHQFALGWSPPALVAKKKAARRSWRTA